MPRWLEDERRTVVAGLDGPRALAGAAAACVGYLAFVILSYRFSYTPSLGIAAIWPPSGLAFGLLVRTPIRHWPLYLLALAVALAVALTLVGHPPSRVVAWSFADLVEPVVGALVVRRVMPTAGLPLVRVREVYLLALAGGLIGPVAGSIVSAIGTTLIGLPDGVSPLRFAFGWWASAFVGALGTGPLVLVTTWPPRRVRPRRALEVAGIAVVLVGLLAFGVAAPNRLAQFLGLAVAAFPLLAWAAVRFGPAGAAWGTAVVSLATIHFTMQRRGPFAMEDAAAHTDLLAVQGFFSMAALTALLLAAVFAERRRIFAGQRLLAEAGAALAHLDPLDARLRRVVELAATQLGDSAVLAASAGGARAFLHAGAPLRPDERAQLRSLPAEVIQRCGDTCCWLYVPLRPFPSGGGLFAVRARRHRHYFDAGEVAVAEGLANRIALAFEKETLADEAERLYREAKEAVVLREQFLSIASHELKTPLTPLATRLELMRRRVLRGLPVELESIDKAKSSLFKLTWLINDLLDVSRIQAGTLELNRRPIELADAVQEALAVLPPADLERVTFLRPEEAHLVDADPHRIEQVVTNLVDNALKYSPSDEEVRVEVGRRGREVWLSVEDHGPGIEPAEQERLFDRLFRGRRAVGSRIGGLGLGLYIVRDIVERHGGRVWVESEKGRGAIFRVALPLLEVREGAPPHEGAAARPGAGPGPPPIPS